MMHSAIASGKQTYLVVRFDPDNGWIIDLETTHERFNDGDNIWDPNIGWVEDSAVEKEAVDYLAEIMKDHLITGEKAPDMNVLCYRCAERYPQSQTVSAMFLGHGYICNSCKVELLEYAATL
jgi:hypothetical protein